MSIKKCVNGSFVNDVYREYGTDTDTITSLPKTIIGDGQNISAYTIKGNMTQASQPSPSNPVYPQETGEKTANLFDVSKVVSGDLTVSGTTITKGSSAYNIDLFSGLSGASTAMSTNSMVLEAGTYTLAYDLVTGNVNLFLICVCPYTSATREPVDKYFDGYNGKSFTISEKSYVSFRVQQNTAVEVKDVAVYSGSTAPPSYEPYGMYKIPILSNGTTYPVYLAEPIRKINNSVDTASSTGTASRAIIKQIFTGNESVSYNSRNVQNQIAAFVISISSTGSTTPEDVVSTHLITRTSASETLNSGGIIMRSTGNHVVVGFPYSVISVDDNMTNAECAAAMKQYLADQYANGTPVTVWYVLATATTESFTAPTIPTSGSPQSFDVDTTLKPSEVSLTYHGWHEHSDTKYTSG